MLEKITFFFDNFLASMRDRKGAHSLTKWCALSVVWVYLVTSVRFTTSENLVAVLGVHAGLIISLFFTHKYYKNKTNDNVIPDSPDTNKAEG